jgi:eukaryotic-like serine/threonine-protein kinase
MSDVTLLVDDLNIPPAHAPAQTMGGQNTCLPRLERTDTGTQLVSHERPRFETTGMLGQGGLGEVVAARDLDIGRKVAIKRIRPDRPTKGAFLRFVQEVRTVGALDHPNIIPLHDVARDEDGQYYFVMKHIEGQTLGEIIRKLRNDDPEAHAEFTFERRTAIFEQVCHAVAFAHTRGVLHRDLKPDNVMVGTHGEVTLLDWGVAKQIGQPDVVDAEHSADDVNTSLTVTQTRVGQLIGTPRYMAPEQARGDAVDERTDIYALCLLFYELLGLSNPFEHLEDLQEVLAAARAPNIRGLATRPGRAHQGRVPADLGWIVNGGLQVDPAQRYQTVQALIDRLDRRAEGHVDVQCAVTAQMWMWQTAVNHARRSPFLWMAGVFFVASVVLAVVLATGMTLGAVFGGALGIALV